MIGHALMTEQLQLHINGQPRTMRLSPSNVATLVAQLGLSAKRLAIELNGEIVPRSQFMDTPLQSGDKLEIVGAVGGG